jgi:hypothetical protein
MVSLRGGCVMATPIPWTESTPSIPVPSGNQQTRTCYGFWLTNSRGDVW